MSGIAFLGVSIDDRSTSHRPRIRYVRDFAIIQGFR
jgi:hypothetical protein